MKKKGKYAPFGIEFYGRIPRALARMIDAIAEIFEEIKDLIIRFLRKQQN